MNSGSSGDSGQTGNDGQEANINLRAQMLQLLSTRLSNYSIKVIQNQLDLMRKSSFYLEIQHHDLPPPADRQQVQQPLCMSNETLLALIDHRRLNRMLKCASDHVKLRITLLDELYIQIIKDCEELGAFINQRDPGLVDGNTQRAMQDKLLQVHEALNEFDNRLKPGPLYMKHKLIPHTGNIPPPEISLSLAIKKPVMFDRFKSYTTSSSAELHWAIASQEPQGEATEFEIHFKILRPTTADQGEFGTVTCSSYSTQIANLIPGRSYQFSVKRVDDYTLVYAMWIETMILDTKAVSTGSEHGCKKRMLPW
ncbi:fibronectin type III domain-containing protein 11-like [Centroberyx gerrardi]|uniref:fibronectin type III domain-containing protein 11-like n=1 Tax=Centroberyx gerrardi TaxID=166262 RepID=UPI003AAE9C02